MFRIDKKAYYVGTWREDRVTDTTMRQIIARSHAEKGQKVKIKLSKEGLDVSRTVLFQENFLSSFPLSDVYFLTVNARHPTCLVCIVADPVKKYLILALRTITEVEAQEIIATFQRLKNNPTIHSGNVVFKRKDNGNWTLRERSQHNADRHMQEIFKEASSSNSSTTTTTPTTFDPMPQPNGHAGVSVFTDTDGGGTMVMSGGRRPRAHSASQTVVNNSEEEMALMRLEMESLSQELRDIKMVLEKATPVTPRPVDTTTTTTYNNHHQNHTETTHHITTQVQTGGGSPVTNTGRLVSARSEGGGVYVGSRPGEVRAIVEDHREEGMVRARSSGSRTPTNKPLFSNGKVQRQITVPEPTSAPNTNTGEPSAYMIQRHATRDFVRIPAESASRKVSSSESMRSSGRVKFHPQLSSRRSHNQHKQFHSMRVSRNSGVPTTVMRPIEEMYGHGNTLSRRQQPVVLVQQPVNAAYLPRHQQQASSVVFVVQEPAYFSRPVTPTSTLRRSDRAGSAYSLQNHEFHFVQKAGELDDVLL